MNENKDSRQRFIEKKLSKDESKNLYFLLCCAICGNFKAFDDFFDLWILRKGISFKNLSVIFSKDKDNVKCKWYKEMNCKMITHCLLDTLLLPLDPNLLVKSLGAMVKIGETEINPTQNRAQFIEYRCSLKEEIIFKEKIDNLYREYCHNPIIQELEKHYKNYNMIDNLSDNIPKENLNYGISLYNKLIDKYPILQFLTSFCRDLPHLYALSLLKQVQTVDLIEQIPITIENDGNSNLKKWQLTSIGKEIFSSIYDNYASTSRMNVDNDEALMTKVDFQNYIDACVGDRIRDDSTRSSRIERIIDMYTNGAESEFFPKRSFLKFYARAAAYGLLSVLPDIVVNGLGYKLCKNNQDLVFETKELANKYQIKCQFVSQLEEKFAKREMILIKYMIKKCGLQKRFDKMNDDISNLIFKMLHPLRINEKDCHITQLNDKIRQSCKYTFNQEHFWDTDNFINADYKLMNQRQFQIILKQCLMVKYKDEKIADQYMSRMKDMKMSLVAFYQHCCQILE